jgi:type IV pilus assembly protein PilA
MALSDLCGSGGIWGEKRLAWIVHDPGDSPLTSAGLDRVDREQRIQQHRSTTLESGMKRNIQKGFTLIELMIVVAIIAILAAIALSQYQDYVIRSQVSEGSALADGIKTADAEYYQNHGNFPTTNNSAGLATAASITGNYVNKVDLVSKGNIGVYFSSTSPQKANSAIDGKVLYFSPITHAGSISWVCVSDSPASQALKQKWCPSSCRCSG